ncbi:MAG: SDR family oxidoreductase [Clostridia bacterium]|nr:SDR family oxidoreductase [Clostridia bacterium]
MGHLQGKTAIVTGGGYAVLSDGRCGSIGYGIATAFAKEGANLVLTGRNEKKLALAKEALEGAYGIRVLAIAADIAAGADNEATAKGVVEAAFKEFGRLDVLVNNAQASASGVTLENHTAEQFDLAIYSGLYATFYYMKAAYPYLKESKGSVINFASGAGLFGNFGQASYAAAKEGIRGLTRVAATEWAKDGINVNVVCPLAWTAQLEQFEKAYPDAFRANVKTPPAGYFGDPEEDIGRACVALTSPDLKYMNGETVTLEGGMGLRP